MHTPSMHSSHILNFIHFGSFSLYIFCSKMAHTAITRSFHVLLWVSSLMLLVRTSSAREFIVGGSSWTLTGNSSAINYNQWAEHNRFQIGDSIVFNYPPGQDSVLEVTREDYSNCTTTSPLHKYSNGHTVFTFSHSGAHYFISGNQDNCQKNQKLVVVVLADRSNMSSSTNQTTTASPPSPMASAPAPVPSGTAETNPTPAPVSSPPKNTASSVHLGSIVFFGALVASSFMVISSGI